MADQPLFAGPKRIRLARVKGWRKPADAVVVARPTRWGNPFTVADHGREAAVARYRERLEETPELAEQARRDLVGRDLACWCPLDEPCHADVLLKVANSRPVSANSAEGVLVPPLGAGPAWVAVVSVAGRRCECIRACGRSHRDADGRCTARHGDWRGHRRVALVVASVDVLLPEWKAAAVSTDELLAWCPDCLTAARRAASDRIAPPDQDSLF